MVLNELKQYQNNEWKLGRSGAVRSPSRFCSIGEVGL